MKEEPFVKNKDLTPKMLFVSVLLLDMGLGTSVIKSDIARPDPEDILHFTELGIK